MIVGNGKASARRLPHSRWWSRHATLACLMAAGTLASATVLHAQERSTQLFVRSNRLHLIRQSGERYRPGFGSVDPTLAARGLDSLLQRGFDPETDLFGYDSTIVGFAGGELVMRREGETSMIVRYPVYPGYLDTVDLTIRRDPQGLAATLAHRPVPVEVDTTRGPLELAKPRVRSEYRETYEFQIFAGFDGDERKFYYQSLRSSDEFYSKARTVLMTFLPFGPLRSKRRSWPLELDERQEITSGIRAITGYDSTIISFVGREVVPLRAGSTQLKIDYGIAIEFVTLDVDVALAITLRPRSQYWQQPMELERK